MDVVLRQWCQLQPGACVIGQDGQIYLLTGREGPTTHLVLDTPPFARWSLSLDPSAYVPALVAADAQALALAALSRYFTLQRIN